MNRPTKMIPTLATTTTATAAAARILARTSPRRSLHVLHSLADLRAYRSSLLAANQSLGFVPTMGALHAGHLDLVAHASKHASKVITSIFVNPAQFAPHEDLDQYPRTLANDIDQLKAQGVADAVWAPSVNDMYPRGISTHVREQRGTFVSVEGLSHQLEGSVRPHFFRGVATVVTKLVNAVQPDVVVFGQKDAQQCCVVRAMLEDLLVNTKMVVAPTVRDHADGLALSSRNRYLSPEERALAPALAAGLMSAQALFEREGVTSAQRLVDQVANIIREVDPSGEKIKVEYIKVTTRELDEVVGDIKVQGNPDSDKSGGTRLIDNVDTCATTAHVRHPSTQSLSM
ncbi:Pantoate-beta-alanine ligase [Catenaria anguillulae PL171]|uniref:Pantoate--beta-alanine ligase n=1 Tax=Catenaria anguillulae PL171 TaxID=765915 RepID=A0A1Y2HL35_9FUNG|nr:Pantoate-beta-alanine ligase [Catenaria anguillulae PL171]